MYTHTHNAIRDNVIHTLSALFVPDMFPNVPAACHLAQERTILSEAGSYG